MSIEPLNSVLRDYDRQQIYVLADSNLRDILVVRQLVDVCCNDLDRCLYISCTESDKTLDTVQRIWDFLLNHQATRRSLLVCIGGGIVTDLGGFAASTFRRGMPYLNIPTTLLGMADAAIGGKTGCNYGGLKNAIGVIREAVDTLIFPELLATLTPEDLLSGYAELVKTALLNNETELAAVIESMEWPENHKRLGDLILHAVRFKQNIVAQDPEEKGLRKQLNLGHTVGHALEEAGIAQGKPIRHGYAVMQGLVAELYLSVIKLNLDKSVLRRISHLMIDQYGKIGWSCKDYPQLVTLMHKDKKNEQADCINFTLLRAVGEPVINQTATQAEIEEALEYLFTL